MKLPQLLLIFLFSLFILFCIGFFQQQAFEPSSRPHPILPEDIPASTLLKSTGGLEDKPGVLILGYIIAILMVGVMGTSVLIGLKKNGKPRPYLPWITIAFVLYGLVFTGLTLSYYHYSQGNSDAFFGGYPLPTAWMVYGVWFFPLIIAGLLILNFDKWFLSQEDLEEFKRLVQERKAEEGGEWR